MRVMTYNILNGGRDGLDGSRWSQVLAVLKAQRPDLVLLNECNLFELEGGQLRYQLEQGLGLRSVLAAAPTGCHLALFVPLRSLRSVRLERRGFHHASLRVGLELSSGPLTVLGCHLSPFSGAQRLLEAQRLCGSLDPDQRVLLLGDLNALSPRDAAQMQPARWPPRYRARHLLPDGTLDTRAVASLEAVGLVDLMSAYGTGDFVPTRPTRGHAGDRPSQRLDYIFASPSLAATCQSCRAVDDPTAHQASDHLPVLAELAF